MTRKIPDHTSSSSVSGRFRRSALAALIVFGLAGLSAASGCGTSVYDYTQDLPEQHLSGGSMGLLLGSILQTPFPFAIDLAKEATAHGSGPAKTVSLTSMTLTISNTSMPSGDTDNFDWIQSGEIYIESADKATILPRRRIAEITSVQPGQTTLNIKVSSELNLLQYITEGNLVSSTGMATQPTDDVSFTGKVTLHVSAL